MNIKVGGPKGSSAVDSKKKVNKGAKAGAPSFASFLQETEKTDVAKSVESSLHAPTAPVSLLEEDADNAIPKQATERGTYMLDQLEELEQDILSGNPTLAAQRLKAALKITAQGTEDLSEAHQKVLDEINMRASIEVAKLENK